MHVRASAIPKISPGEKPPDPRRPGRGASNAGSEGYERGRGGKRKGGRVGRRGGDWGRERGGEGKYGTPHF